MDGFSCEKVVNLFVLCTWLLILAMVIAFIFGLVSQLIKIRNTRKTRD